MKKYVTEEMLSCVKDNGTFPQDVDITKWQFLHFGKIGLTLIYLANNGEKVKHINYWQSMTASEINELFNTMPWSKE